MTATSFSPPTTSETLFLCVTNESQQSVDIILDTLCHLRITTGK